MNKKINFSILAFFLVVSMLSFASAITIKDVSTLPTETAPGETVSVVLEIENTFDYDVTNLNVKLDLTRFENMTN